jgi:hypothetical protein
MKFNSRHKKALEYYVRYPNEDRYPPGGVGEVTMKELAKNGYVTCERAWFGNMYRITQKGLKAVGQNWLPDTAEEKLEKWNAAVKGKGGA